MRYLRSRKGKYIYPKVKNSSLKKYINNNMYEEATFYYPNVDIRKERTNCKVLEIFLYFIAVALTSILVFIQVYGAFFNNNVLVRHKEEGVTISKLQYIYDRGELRISFSGKISEVMPWLVINGNKVVSLSDNITSIIEIKENDILEIDCREYDGSGYVKVEPINTENEDMQITGNVNLKDFKLALQIQQGKKYYIGRVVSIY